MKITKKFLNQKYNELYEDALRELRKRNPCAFLGGQCRAIYGQHEKVTCCEHGFMGQQGTCKYLGKNGCRVKALRCKAWYCDYVDDPRMGIKTKLHSIGGSCVKYYRTINRVEFEILIKEMDKYGFTIFRGSKKDQLQNAYKKFGLTHET